MQAKQANIKWLDDPRIYRVNQLQAHSDHITYASQDEAVQGKSSLYQSLNGQWRFHYASNAGKRPADFYQNDFDYSGFDEITVPMHIAMAGYDKIHYINTMHPWEGHDFRRASFTLSPENKWDGIISEADYNPVGSYITTFALNPSLKNKDITIRFEGVEQAMYLWLNGEFVGYAEDSFTPSEFDLTPYLQEENTLAVEVYKHGIGTFIEGQDFFRFFGIFRDVNLIARPANHLHDLWLKPTLMDDYHTGRLEIDLSFENIHDKSTYSVKIASPSGEVLFTHDADFKDVDIRNKKSNLQVVRIDAGEFPNAEIWSNKNPNLYLFTLTNKNSAGEVTEVTTYPFGFRRVEIKNNIIMLNGKRHIINGVNRHEWHPKRGRAITKCDIDSDIEIIKRNNINSVRTSHYPNQIYWYQRCDQEGIYLMSETNMESHATWHSDERVGSPFNVPGEIPEWREMAVDRAKTNYMTFRNHTSVLFWSLGNESYAGANTVAMYEFFKTNDPHRLVHYEGSVRYSKYIGKDTDMYSTMYATPSDIAKYMENDPQQPYVICEYMHDMGNSLGGLKSYTDLLDKYEMYHGGYIWDFKDQAIYVYDEITKKDVLRYGGDFDDRPADYEFSGNGIVFADGTEKPALQEVKYYYGKYSE